MPSPAGLPYPSFMPDNIQNPTPFNLQNDNSGVAPFVVGRRRRRTSNVGPSPITLTPLEKLGKSELITRDRRAVAHPSDVKEDGSDPRGLRGVRVLARPSGLHREQSGLGFVWRRPGDRSRPGQPLGAREFVRGPIWASDNGTGLSILYNGAANRFPLVVTIPAPTHGSPPTAPTGVAVRAQTADPPVHFAECAEDQCRSSDAPLAQPADDLDAVEAWQ